jgi:CheY-like chemotaxis protein
VIDLADQLPTLNLMSSLDNSPPVILIVDDDEGHALLIRQNLAVCSPGSRVEHFSSGEAVLDFFFGRGSGPTWQPCQQYVVLLDLRMPRIGGIEVLRQIKADPKLHSMVVIMLSTSDAVEEIARCHHLGCNFYVTKPVDAGLFSRAVCQIGRFIEVLLLPSAREGMADAGI